jgi:hypothetical protein
MSTLNQINHTLDKPIAESIPTIPTTQEIKISLQQKASNVNYWDLTILGQFLIFLIVFTTPVSKWINTGIGTVVQTTKATQNILDKTADFIAPDIKRDLKKGDKVGAFTVTDVMGSPREGGKRAHAGTDIGMPEGTQLYIPDDPNKSVDVKFFSYQYNRETQGKANGIKEYGAEFITSYGVKIRVIHLSKIHGSDGGTKPIKGGTVFALSGWHHAHIEQYENVDGTWKLTPLSRDIAMMMIQGKIINERINSERINSNQENENQE